MKKSAVLFDLDDTLSQGEAAYNKALQATGELWMSKYPQMNFERFSSAFASARSNVFLNLGPTANAGNRIFFFQQIMEQENLPQDFKWILKLNHVYWKEYLRSLEPREGAAKTLSNLKKRGVKIGIVTNLTTEIQIKKLITLKLDKNIDVMISGEEAGVVKPNQKIFGMALKKLGVTADNALMVGDDIEPDIKGGMGAGMETALIENSWHVYTEEERTLATYRLNNLTDILKIIV